jgi:hypothetical protein
MNFRAASTSVVSGGFIPGFEQSDMRAEVGASRIRYREFGGEWRVSDTAKPSRPNQRDLHMGFTRRLSKAQANLILYGNENGSSRKIKLLERQEIRIENNKYRIDGIEINFPNSAFSKKYI